MMRAIFCSVLLVVSSVAAGSVAQAKLLKEQLVGTWIAYSIVNTSDSGEKTMPYSEHPLGTYMFDEAGHFAEIIINPEKEGVTVDFFGTYSADEGGKGFVLHVVGSSAKRFTGTDAKRDVLSISDDMMELRNPNPTRGGGPATSMWKRAK
jgi:hypothetical protein